MEIIESTSMIILDSILLLTIIIALHIVKLKYPNFLFFCKGAILFLPPDEASSKTQKPKKQVTEEPQIKILQLEYKHIKDYPMSDEYDRLIFVFSSLIIYIPLKYIICQLLLHFYDNTLELNSTFTLIVGTVVLAYCIKLGIQIFLISSYNIKYCLAAVIIINILYFVIHLALRSLGQENLSLENAVTDYQKHMSIVFGQEIFKNVTPNLIIIVILIMNGVLILISIPAVIKFGNWYTKILKEIYYEDEETYKILEGKEKEERIQKENILKNKSKFCVRLLNLYLFSLLLFICFSHPYIQNHIGLLVSNILRIILTIIIIFINCYTLKDAIEFNGSFAYKFLGQYLNLGNSESELETKLGLRKRIIQYLYFTWYHKFQFMFRIFVPVLLFIVLMDSTYMPVAGNALTIPPIVGYTSCGVETDKLALLNNLYYCSSSSLVDLQTVGHSEPFINGLLVQNIRDTEMGKTQERMGRYGLVYGGFIKEVLENLIWYYGVSLFGMTVVYVLFLRKTVYDI